MERMEQMKERPGLVKEQLRIATLQLLGGEPPNAGHGDQTLLDLADEVYEMHDGRIRPLRGPGATTAEDMFKPPEARAAAVRKPAVGA